MSWYESMEESLQKDARRLSEILDELAGIKRIFEAALGGKSHGISEEAGAKKALSGVEATRIPGFCAFNLAGQALLLLSMISLRIIMMERTADRPELMLTMANLRKVVEQTEPHLKQTFEEMRPWGSLDTGTIAEAIASRPSGKRPS